MLLADRRMALVHFSLVGMAALWFTPLFLIFWRDSSLGLLEAVGWLLAGALLWTLVVEAAEWLEYSGCAGVEHAGSDPERGLLSCATR
jgi:hypothetical protein